MKNKGYTLIELLIVIIIVGILSAIALPSFLNQASKARASEAKVNISTVNRTQQTYYLEHQEFADDLDKLNLGINNTDNYNYKVYPTIITEDKGIGIIANAINPNLSSFLGAVQVKNDKKFKSVICESEDNVDLASLNRVVVTNLHCRREGKKLGK